MTISKRIENRLDQLGIEFFHDSYGEINSYFLHGKQLVSNDNANVVSLLDENGDTVKVYKNVGSAIKAAIR